MKATFFDAIIFDMDGVLVDSEPIHVKAEKLTCRHLGLKVPEEEWGQFQGKTARDIADHILEKYQVTTHFSADDFIAHKTNLYLELAKIEIAPIMGAIEFVNESRRNFSQLGLVTSSKTIIQRYVLERYFSRVNFDVIVTGDEIPAGKGKPHPFPYLGAIEQLGLSAERCLVIEDSDNGVMSAKAAGCLVIGIATSFPLEKLISIGADVAVESYSQMSQMLFS